jgi:hypothetical protein
MSSQRDWQAPDDDIITGQVVTGGEDDADPVSAPQETFLHKVASAPRGHQDAVDEDALDDSAAGTDDTNIEETVPDSGSYPGTYPAASPAADYAGGQDMGATRTDIPVVAEPSYQAWQDTDDAPSVGKHASPVADEPVADEPVADAPVANGPVANGTVANGTGPKAGRPDDPAFAVDADESLLGDTAVFRDQWRRVQADFVDDPRSSVTEAAGVVADAASRLEAALRDRQQSLRSSWDGNGQADTETMRQALLMYRRLLDKLIG